MLTISRPTSSKAFYQINEYSGSQENHFVAHIRHKDGCLCLTPDLSNGLSCTIYCVVEQHHTILSHWRICNKASNFQSFWQKYHKHICTSIFENKFEALTMNLQQKAMSAVLKRENSSLMYFPSGRFLIYLSVLYKSSSISPFRQAI